jgi:hypothetical protein
MVHECCPAMAAELAMAEPDSLTTPWQEPSVPVAQKVSVPAATSRVVAPPALPHLAAPKRLLQIWLVRAAVLTATALPLPALAAKVTLAEMGANSAEVAVRTRPDGPQSTGPAEEVASTSAQDVDWPAH